MIGTQLGGTADGSRTSFQRKRTSKVSNRAIIVYYVLSHEMSKGLPDQNLKLGSQPVEVNPYSNQCNHPLVSVAFAWVCYAAMFFNLEAVLEFLICETEEEPRQAEKETRAAGGWLWLVKACRFDSRLMPLRRNMADASVY